MANITLSEEEYNELKKSRDSWRERYYELRYALRKDEQLDESISCSADISSDVEMIEDLKKRAADSDYYKEKCKKKYHDEISKLQNIVTEKEVEIKKLKKEIINLGFDRITVKDIMKKNDKLNQTISDQEVTIKSLLITIKEMCKEDETNA